MALTSNDRKEANTLASERYDLIVRNGMVVTETRTQLADVAVSGGQITRIGPRMRAQGNNELDAQGCYVVPGGVDVHTHFGNKAPLDNLETADDWESGTRAAAAGGVTTAVNFAFQQPGASLLETVTEELRRAGKQSVIDYSVHPVILDMRDGDSAAEITPLARDGFTSVKIFTGPAGIALEDRDVITVLSAATAAGSLVAVHPEDIGLSTYLRQRAQAAQVSARPGGNGLTAWRASYAPAVEALAVERVAGYAREVGAASYFVHISSAQALEAVVVARRRGGVVFCETRPAYLFLDDSRYQTTPDDAALAVCLPPLRPREEQPALWEGLRTGHIQTIGSDHTARMAHEKLGPFHSGQPVPAGFGGVQTSLPLLFGAGVLAGQLTIRDYVRVSSANPSKLFGLWPKKGRIGLGGDADLVVLDPSQPVKVDQAMLESRSDFDVYTGLKALGWPTTTISRGEIIWQAGTVHGQPGRGHLQRRPVVDYHNLHLGNW